MPSGCLPLRPANSSRRMGTPVPSPLAYRIGASHGPGCASRSCQRLAPRPTRCTTRWICRAEPRCRRSAAKCRCAFQIGRLVGPFQTDQPGQGGRVAHFQAQRGIGRIVALFLAGMVDSNPELKGKLPNRPCDLEDYPALARFARLGLVGGIDALGGLLQKHAHQRVGGLEEGGAHQQFQFLHPLAAGCLSLEMGHQLLDFRVLGEEDFRPEVFFFAPASRSARVWAMTKAAYWPTKSWNR